MGYLADTYRKSKQWFRNTDGSIVDSENGPPPPMANQPTKHPPSKPISSNPNFAQRPVKPSPKRTVRPFYLVNIKITISSGSEAIGVVV